MRIIGSFAAASGAAGLLALVAAYGWVAPASAQSLVSQAVIQPSASINIWGAGYFDNHAYFGTFDDTNNNILIYKVATGNAGGPSDTAPSLVNYISVPVDGNDEIYDGVVDSTNGLGYWVVDSDPITIIKTSGNAGSTPMTLVGTYTFGAAGDTGCSIALDETTQMLYVGGAYDDVNSYIYKLSAGGPTAVPTLVDTLAINFDVDGYNIFGMALDTKNGYGYAGTAGNPDHVIMFTLGANGVPMTRVGNMPALDSVFGMQFNPLTGALYAGFDSSEDGQMWTTSATGALPVDQGQIEFGEGDGIYTNKAFVLNSECNILYASTYSKPSYINFFDMGTGKALPTFLNAIKMSETEYGQSGVIDQYGYSYFTTENPFTVYKFSNPTCTSPNPAGGPFTLTGSKSKAKRAARPGTSFKVTFSLTRWAAGYESGSGRRELLGGMKGTWEMYDVLLALPGQGATLTGKPRVTPRIPKRKGADTANNTLIAWNQVPMRLLPGTKKNYTRKFSFAIKVDKTFVGANLTFGAAATGPQQGYFRETMLTVPITRK